jgi:hypothetical protein
MKLPIEGKSVLEVGSGIGQLTHFFEERECVVHSTDGRIENVMENLRRNPHRNGRVWVSDVLVPHSHSFLGRFNFVFCYGLLYHVGNPSLCLFNLKKTLHENGILILSSIVNQVDNGKINYKMENRESTEMSLDGSACDPARDWIWNTLSRFFDYVYMPIKQPPDPQYPTRWPSRHEQARAVFVASRERLNLPSLSSELLMEQESLPWQT